MMAVANSKSKNSLTQNQAEPRHAHQGLGRPSLVVAGVYHSPWVMPGVPLVSAKISGDNKTQTLPQFGTDR